MATTSARGQNLAGERLIVALDTARVDDAKALVKTLAHQVSFFKIGLHLQLHRGVESFIDELLADGRRVFIDYKFADIPETVRGGVAGAAGRGVHFVTLQGAGAAPEVLAAAAEGRGGSNLKVLLVTVLTSMGAGDVGAGSSIEDLVRERARRALEAGLDGVVASGREAALIREIAGPEKLLIVTPGVRPAGAALDDHKRAVTPGEAIANGADYLVVGRPIVKAEDPRAAAEGIIEEMQAAFDARA